MRIRYGFAVAMALAFGAAPAGAEVSELKISKQPGLLFAPMILMEHHKLVEKHAKDAGVPDLKAGWVTLMSGGANNDALLSGSLHIVTSGVTNMLLLWGKTNGDVKAIIGVSGLPFKLITRNPNIKTIKDYTLDRPHRRCRRCASRSRPSRWASPCRRPTATTRPTRSCSPTRCRWAIPTRSPRCSIPATR